MRRKDRSRDLHNIAFFRFGGRTRAKTCVQPRYDLLITSLCESVLPHDDRNGRKRRGERNKKKRATRCRRNVLSLRRNPFPSSLYDLNCSILKNDFLKVFSKSLTWNTFPFIYLFFFLPLIEFGNRVELKSSSEDAKRRNVNGSPSVRIVGGKGGYTRTNIACNRRRRFSYTARSLPETEAPP